MHNHETFVKLVDWAKKVKIRPDDNTLTREDMLNLYNNTRDFFFYGINYYFGSYAKYLLNPRLAELRHFVSISFWIHCLYSKLFTHNKYKKYYDIYFAQNYIMNAYSRTSINKAYLKRAKVLLSKWNVLCPTDEWDVLRYSASIARNNI